MTATYETLLRLDAALVANGHNPLTQYWKETSKRLYEHPSAKSLVAAIGRGGAKSHTSSKIAANEVLFGAWRVPPGERHFWAFASKTKDEAAQRIVLLCSFLRAMGVPFDVSGDTISLQGKPLGFKVFAAQVGAVSGFRCVGYSADELAKWMGSDYSNPAAEVCASLGAMTITHPGARSVKISSPFGADGYFFDCFERGNNEHQIVATAPSWIANPDGISEQAAHAIEQDPKVFAREYGALFDSIVSNAFERDDVLGCYGRQLLGFPQEQGFLCTDASALRGDTFAVIEGRFTPKGEIAITSVYGWSDDQQRKITLADVADHIARRCKALKTKFAYGDQGQAGGLLALCAERGIQFKSMAWSQSSKSEAITTLRRMMREGTLRLPEHDKLKRELLGLRARILESGGMKYLSNGVDFASALICMAHFLNADELVVGSGNALFDVFRDARDRGTPIGGGSAPGDTYQSPGEQIADSLMARRMAAQGIWGW